MSKTRFFGILPALAALAVLGACEVSYKAQDDAMYYGDRAIGQYHKIRNYVDTRFGDEPRDTLPLHLSNFDTFICDGARQLVANFDAPETAVGVTFEGRNKYLTRANPYHPFTDGIYDLFIMEDGTLLMQRDGATLFQHCRPLVADINKARPYEYTPTVTPIEYHSAEPAFEQKMAK